MYHRLSLSRVLCLTPLLFSSSLLAQSSWSKAPPLPRACYSEQDAFQDQAATAMSELEAAIEKQEAINKGLVEQVMKMDPATLQQRMMEAVQKDPARSQEIIEATQAMATAQGQAAVAEVGSGESEFAAKKAKLIADYKTEKPAVMSLYGTRARAEDVKGHQDLTDPAELAENNTKYQTVLCPKWFTKEIPALLASYRTHLVEQRIPKLTAAEIESTRMPEMFGVSTKEFRPIAEMRGVVDYLRFATELFGLRESETLKGHRMLP